VELNGYFNKVGPNRKDVRFKSAQVDFGGFKVSGRMHHLMVMMMMMMMMMMMGSNFGLAPEHQRRKDGPVLRLKTEFVVVKVTFPHMDIFGVSGWLETTFVDEHIRICRGNRGSIFVLTRRPLAGTA
jgi:hypothetical protein